MLFLASRWNLTLPDSAPLQLELNIDEKALRVYEVYTIETYIFKMYAIIDRFYKWVKICFDFFKIKHRLDWFGANHLNLDVEWTDRGRRNKVDTSVWVTVATRSIDNYKFGVHYLSEERETKLKLQVRKQTWLIISLCSRFLINN